MLSNWFLGRRQRPHSKHVSANGPSTAYVLFYVLIFLWVITLLALVKQGISPGDDAKRTSADVRLAIVQDDVGAHRNGNVALNRDHAVAKEDDAVVKPPINANYRKTLNGVECPLYGSQASNHLSLLPSHGGGVKKSNSLRKHYRRINNCLANSVWHHVHDDDFNEMFRLIVQLASVKRDSFVLNWGSGCGQGMQLLGKEFNVQSVGIDVLDETIDYARETTSNDLLHCVADETNMAWIPSSTFDHVISFGFLGYVSNQAVFCHVLRQMVRVTKPSGTIYNGWSDDSDFKREHVPLCFADLPVTYEIVEERLAFSSVATFPLKKKKNMRTTYSLVVRKNPGTRSVSDDVYNNIEYVPFRCSGPEGTDCHANDRAVNPLNNVEDKNSPMQKAVKRDESSAVEHIKKKGEKGAALILPKSAERVSSIKWPECPPYSRAFEDRQIPLKHLPRRKATSVSQKYDRRAHNCHKDGIWHRVSINDHRMILQIIANLLGVTKSCVLFDWGSGCGHHLQFMYEQFGAVGLGIDISNKTTEYARAVMSPESRYCVADGTKLEWLPSNFFDHAYSFGSIFHVYNKTLFCSVLRQVMRTVKVGGKFYNGWTQDGEYPRWEVLPCLLMDMAPSCVKVEIFEDAELFRKVPYFPRKARRQRPDTYSVLIHKLLC